MKFVRHLLAAALLVVSVFLVGVGLEHSPLAQSIAPHDDTPQAISVVKRDGQVYVKVVRGSQGHTQTTLQKVKTAPTAGHPVDLGGARGSPFSGSDWPQAAAIFLVIVAGAAGVGQLHRLRLAMRRRTRAPVVGA